MKTIKLILIALLIAVTSSGLSQIDPEVKELNKPFESQSVSTIIKPKLDSVVHDWTNGLRDDTALYFSSGTNRAGFKDSIRPIYFIHGLGGNETSWNRTYNAHVREFRYAPYKLDYYGNQSSFSNATFEAYTEMGVKLSSYKLGYPSGFDTVSRPYAIAHSLGGLIARDMDMKHDSSNLYDPLIRAGERHFYGLVTFGSPHAGAEIVGNQQELAHLGGDLAGKILAVSLDTVIDKLITGLPWVAQTFIGTGALSTAPSKIGNYFADSLAAKILTQFTKDQTDPIGKQFTPTSTYLTDTLNQYINPKLAKALFWGQEEDPILWRMAYYLVNGPNTFSTFGANEDSKLANAMEKMRIDAKAWSYVYKGHADWHLSRAKRFYAFWRGIGKSNSDMARYGVTKLISRDFMALHQELNKVNLKYKAIIGAVNDSNLYLIDTVSYRCIKKQTVTFHNNGNLTTTVPRVSTFNSTGNCPNDTSWTQTYTSTIYTQYDVTYELEVTTKKTLIETPSDATVLASSAKAFPGCIDDYKNFMGPVPLPGGGMSRGKVNHLQMRNCIETDDALRKIYNGDDVTMPEFFRLHKW